MLGVTWEQLEKRLYVVKNHAVSTKQGQRVRFNFINEYFMRYPFTEETIYDFIADLQNKGKADGTINNYAKLLKHICHILKVDYMRDFTYRKDEGTKVIPLDQDELISLIKVAYKMSLRIGVIIETLFQTGMRNSEICNLRISDYEVTRLKLGKTKSQKIQYVQILPTLAKNMELLIAQVKKDYTHDYIFGCKRGKLYRDTLNVYIRQAGKKAGIEKDVRSHVLRHTACDLAAKKGLSLNFLQHFMRHAEPKTTARYTHFGEAEDRKVAEIITITDMSYETYVSKLKEFHQQYPNTPFKVTLLEERGKVLLEVCNNVNELRHLSLDNT